MLLYKHDTVLSAIWIFMVFCEVNDGSESYIAQGIAKNTRPSLIEIRPARTTVYIQEKKTNSTMQGKRHDFVTAVKATTEDC